MPKLGTHHTHVCTDHQGPHPLVSLNFHPLHHNVPCMIATLQCTVYYSAHDYYSVYTL